MSSDENQKTEPVLIQMRCKRCGGITEVDEDMEIISCPYCGYKELIVVNDAVRVEKLKTEAYEKIELGKQELELERLKEAEKANRRNRRNKLLRILITLLILSGLAVVAVKYGSSYYETYRTMNIRIPFASKDLANEDYETVESRFEDAGFTNIETKDLNDLNFVSGIFTKENTIDKVMINGDSDFSSGDTFPKDAAVVITYHSHPD